MLLAFKPGGLDADYELRLAPGMRYFPSCARELFGRVLTELCWGHAELFNSAADYFSVPRTPPGTV